LTWNQPVFNTPLTFQIYLGAAFGTATQIGTTGDVLFQISQNGTYWVVANSAQYGQSPEPASITISDAASTLPDPTGPINFTLESNTGDLTLAWGYVQPFPAIFANFQLWEGVSIVGGVLLGTPTDLSFTIKNPAVGANTYWVRAVDIHGNYDQTPISGSFTVPSPYDVQNLGFYADAKDRIWMTWNPPSSIPAGFAGYYVYVGPTLATATPIGVVAGVKNNNTEIPNLSFELPLPMLAGTNLYWVVCMTQTGAASAGVSISITTPLPNDPTNLQLKILTKDDVYAWWVPPTAGLKKNHEYSIHTGATWNPTPANEVGRTTHPFITLAEQPPGSQTYWVGIIDSNGAYDLIPSGPVSITVPYPPEIDVTHLGYTVTPARDLTVAWRKPTGLPVHGEYAVWYSQVDNWSAISATEPDKVKTLNWKPGTPLAPGDYYVWVEVFDLKGWYSASYYGSGPTPLVVTIPGPNDPYNFKCNNGTNNNNNSKAQLKFTWAVPTAGLKHGDIYQIWYGSTSTFSASTCTHVADIGKGTTFTDPDPVPGNYYYFVVTKDDATPANYDPYPPSLFITVAIPGAVTSPTYTTVNATLVVSWGKPTSLPSGPVRNYEVRMSTSSTTTWGAASVISTPAGLSYTNKQPVAGQIYYYFIGVYDQAGNCSHGAGDTYDVAAELPAINSVTFGSTPLVINKNKVMSIDWNPPSPAPSGQSHYDVRISTSNIPWASMPAWQTPKTNSIQWSGHSPNTTYYIGIAVVDAVGNHDASPPVIYGSTDAGFKLDVTQADPNGKALVDLSQPGQLNVGAFPGNLQAGLNAFGEGMNSSTFYVAASSVQFANASGQTISLVTTSSVGTGGWISYANSGLGGLDTGSWGVYTRYYVYLIYNPTTQTVGAIASSSATGPTLPSGYTYWRLVSMVFTLLTGFGVFSQSGNIWTYAYNNILNLLTSTLNTGWTQLFSSNAFYGQSLLYVSYTGASGQPVSISTDGSTAFWQSYSSSSAYGTGHVWVPNGTVYYATGSGSSGTLAIYRIGFALNI
jgi:hypothetical protein